MPVAVDFTPGEYILGSSLPLNGVGPIHDVVSRDSGTFGYLPVEGTLLVMGTLGGATYRLEGLIAGQWAYGAFTQAGTHPALYPYTIGVSHDAAWTNTAGVAAFYAEAIRFFVSGGDGTTSLTAVFKTGLILRKRS